MISILFFYAKIPTGFICKILISLFGLIFKRIKYYTICNLFKILKIKFRIQITYNNMQSGNQKLIKHNLPNFKKNYNLYDIENLEYCAY